MHSNAVSPPSFTPTGSPFYPNPANPTPQGMTTAPPDYPLSLPPYNFGSNVHTSPQETEVPPPYTPSPVSLPPACPQPVSSAIHMHASQTLPAVPKETTGRTAFGAVMTESKDSEIFRVQVERTESSDILQMHGEYVMAVINEWMLTLSPLSPTQRIVEWNLAHIRSFDCETTKEQPRLVIVTGRRSSTGLGTFHFLTPRAQDALILLTAKTRMLAHRK
jgi:hypothetical protein